LRLVLEQVAPQHTLQEGEEEEEEERGRGAIRRAACPTPVEFFHANG